MVSVRMKAVVVAVGIIAASLGVAAPAGADPADDPCGIGGLTEAFLCRLMPIAPGLDHDIDLTQGSESLNGQSLPEMPDGAPISDGELPTPVCTNGCE